MKSRIILLLIIALLSFSATMEAQKHKKKEKQKEKEKTEQIKENENDDEYISEDDIEFDFDDWDEDFGCDFGRFAKFRIPKNPFMEFSYGLSDVKHNSFNTKFNNIGMGELRLGYRGVYEGDKDYLVELNEKFLSIALINKDLYTSDNSLSKYNAEFLRFGLGSTSGFGYKFGAFEILPYHTSSYDWTSLRKIEYNGVNPGIVVPDDELLNMIGSNFRFGRSIEGGVKIGLASAISINAGYEASVIFQRHLFWYWAGSALIEEIGNKLIFNFIDRAIESSPSVGPVVSFILKNAYSYCFYLLRKDSMNWPFATEKPMTIESFKLGVTFAF